MGARDDQVFLFVSVAVFIVAVASIVLMVGPLIPSFSSSNSLTGQVYAVGDDIDNRYAPPWDVFTDELFFDVTQPVYTGLTASDEVTVAVSIDRPGAFIRKSIYYRDGTSWRAAGTGGWTKDSYDVEINFTVGNLDEENYLLIHTCLKNPDVPNGLDCGCKDEDDPYCRSFAIQEFDGPAIAPSGCTSDTNCTGDEVCDVATGICEECLITSDCNIDEECVEEKCIPLLGCVTDADCRETSFAQYDTNNRYCKQTTGECVECKLNSHCPVGKECTNNVCTLVTGTGCTSNSDCTAPTPKCDTSLGECFECLIDGDCASTEYCDAGSCEDETPSTITDLVITKNTVLFQSEATYDCGAGPSPASSPSISGFVYDEDTGAIYTNDHAGMTRFLVNKLQAPTVTIKDLHGASNSPTLCQINEATQTVANCIGISGDTAGCVAPRTYWPIMDGEGVVHVETTHSLTHANSLLLHSDIDGSFDLDVEFGNAKEVRTTAPFIVARGNNNGDAIVGGMPGFKGNYVQLFDTGSKRYGLLAVGAGHTTSVTLSNLRLIDLTNTFSPVDLGRISQYPDFYKLITPLCSASGSCYLSALTRNMKSATPEKRTIIKEGSQYVLYDYTDPTAITELDHFSCNSAFCYEGPVLGIRNGLDAILEGDTVYVHIPGGAEHLAIVKKDYPELNPLKVNKCYDRARKPCYFGQVWKHTIGTNGWQKAVDVPGTLVQIRDGKLWLFGSGLGVYHGPDGIYDPNQLHAIPYTGNVYNANIFPDYRLKVYDLTDGSELLHEELKVPVNVFRPSMSNSPSLAVMQENGKYYVYILYWLYAGAPNHINYLIGYEATPCSGASCNVGDVPLTTTTGAIVTIGGSGGSGGGGGSGVCGDGTVNSGEACDDGANNGICPKTCSATCSVNSCGPCTCAGEGYDCGWQMICGHLTPCGGCTTGVCTDGTCGAAAPTTHPVQKKVERAPGDYDVIASDTVPASLECNLDQKCIMWSNCAKPGLIASNIICASTGITSICTPAMSGYTRGGKTCCSGSWGTISCSTS